MRARLGVRLRGAPWLAQPHDPVKGKGGKDRENASIGLPSLGSDRRRHSRLPRDACPVGEDQKQRLDFAPRHGAEVQQGFCHLDHGTRPRRRVLSAARPLIQGPATRVIDLRNEPPRKCRNRPLQIRPYQHRRASTNTIVQKMSGPRPPERRALPGEVTVVAGRPEADDLVGIFSPRSATRPRRCLRRFAGSRFSSFSRARSPI